MRLFVTQGASIDAEYRKYSRATQQSLQAWNGEQIDYGLVREPYLGIIEDGILTL